MDLRVFLVNEWIELAATEFALSSLEYIMSTIFFINHTQSLISAQNIGSLSRICDDAAIYHIWYTTYVSGYVICISELQTVGNVERIS